MGQRKLRLDTAVLGSSERQVSCVPEAAGLQAAATQNASCGG